MSADALPPSGRTPTWAPLTDAAREGRLVLQSCADCGALQYPPREICHACLGPVLAWGEVSGAGAVLAATTLHASNEPWFAARLPWHIAKIRLDAGPMPIVHLDATCLATGTRVTVLNRLDRSGTGVLVAVPEGATTLEDAKLRDLLHT